MNIDLEISNLVKAARVKQAKEGLKRVSRNGTHFTGGGLGRGRIYFQGG